MGRGSRVVKGKSPVAKILEVMMRVAEVDMPDFVAVEPVLMVQISQQARRQDTLGEHAKSHPLDMGTVDRLVGHPLQGVPVSRALQLASKPANGFVAAAGMNGITMKKDPVPDDAGKLMPEQIGMLFLKSLQGLHVGWDRIMISQNDPELTLREFIQQGLDEMLRGGHRPAENPVLGPLEVKYVPVQDEDIDFPCRRLDLPQIATRPGVVTEEMQIRYGRPNSHYLKIGKIASGGKSKYLMLTFVGTLEGMQGFMQGLGVGRVGALFAFHGEDSDLVSQRN